MPRKAPSALFKALLREAGARACVENTAELDYATIGGGLIGINSLNRGNKTLTPLNGGPIGVSMPPFSAQYFDLQTGKPLNEAPTPQP